MEQTQVNDSYFRDVIDPGDRASKLAKEVCFKSHNNNQAASVVVPYYQADNFRGLTGFLWKPHILQQLLDQKFNQYGEVIDWTMMESMQNDGAGGKPQFFTLANIPEIFEGLAWEIITMIVDDFARTGSLAVILVRL